MHFFNPVHKMPLVEVARAPSSNDQALATLTQWAIDLGKTPVVVRDSPGFVVNRILMPYLNEGVLLVSEGLAIEQVDRAMKRFGMPMGPLELLDQIGLDVAASRRSRCSRCWPADSSRTRRSRRCAPAACWDRRAGAASMSTTARSRRSTRRFRNCCAASIISSATSALPAAVRVSEGRERMVLLMVNEAALGLSEGLTANAAAIDLAMVLGTGWAPHRGGPLRYADDRGLADIVQALRTLAARHGRRFEPCAEMIRRAEANEPFTRPTPALV